MPRACGSRADRGDADTSATIYAVTPRRRRDTLPRTIHVAPAASPRRVSSDYPRGGRSARRPRRRRRFAAKASAAKHVSPKSPLCHARAGRRAAAARGVREGAARAHVGHEAVRRAARPERAARRVAAERGVAQEPDLAGDDARARRELGEVGGADGRLFRRARRRGRLARLAHWRRGRGGAAARFGADRHFARSRGGASACEEGWSRWSQVIVTWSRLTRRHDDAQMQGACKKAERI